MKIRASPRNFIFTHASQKIHPLIITSSDLYWMNSYSSSFLHNIIAPFYNNKSLFFHPTTHTDKTTEHSICGRSVSRRAWQLQNITQLTPPTTQHPRTDISKETSSVYKKTSVMHNAAFL